MRITLNPTTDVYHAARRLVLNFAIEIGVFARDERLGATLFWFLAKPGCWRCSNVGQTKNIILKELRNPFDGIDSFFLLLPGSRRPGRMVQTSAQFSFLFVLHITTVLQ
jgi:hypothetical protein